MLLKRRGRLVDGVTDRDQQDPIGTPTIEHDITYSKTVLKHCFRSRSACALRGEDY
ncbi:hypothetical protein [Shinella sp. HZN7]|uniref:hypothetical protein n=1 Tax=Shinella sp. (strain HZN7) TaxID=879274 RepID=UPI001439974A|nr:hypothetical protein [Shinella sp. HZN7]